MVGGNVDILNFLHHYRQHGQARNFHDIRLQFLYFLGMGNIRIDLPSDLVQAANLEIENVSQEAARLLALELYREGKVSLGRAAELCQTPLAAFMEFSAKHGVSPLRYKPEELDEESRLSGRLKA